MNAINSTFPLDLLSDGNKRTPISSTVVSKMELLIINAFRDKGITISEVLCVVGPTVVRFELIPDKGFKLKQIRSCEDKLNEALSDYGPIRLIAPVPGKGTIAVEVPRPDRQMIRFREVIESKEFQESQAYLPVALGIDSENNTLVADLAKMPNLLVSGATGQGKSVLLNNIILSLLYILSPALDVSGAQLLLGMGDMLFNNSGDFKRLRSCFIDTPEIESICEWIQENVPVGDSYILPVTHSPLAKGDMDNGRDPLFCDVARSIIESGMASTSNMQRRFGI